MLEHVKLRRIFLIIGGTGILVVVVLLIFIPKIQVASLRNAKGVDAKDVFKAENDARATLAQILGGFAVLIGLVVAWQNLRQNISETTQSLEATNKNLELTKEGQVTERFTKAIEQLGNSKLEIRLGGIYALERIARNSERDHWPIMEVLTAYVREHAPRKEVNMLANQTHHIAQKPCPVPVATDIQAIMTVISRRERSHEKGQHLDLHAADLHGANLMGAHLENAYLWDANLIGAHLEGAHLEDASLEGAYLIGAFLGDAYLIDAQLESAHLEGANLIGAHLGGVQLEDAYLRGAFMGADLAGANLMRAHLAGARLIGAELEGAYLWGTDLTDAIGVTQEQVNSAKGNTTTRLPPGIVMPESWKRQASG
jgi:hypothetical protein